MTDGLDRAFFAPGLDHRRCQVKKNAAPSASLLQAAAVTQSLDFDSHRLRPLEIE